MKILDKTEDGNLDEQEKIKKNISGNRMGIKTTVCHHRTGRICDFLLLHTVFLYDLPLQWIHRLLEEAVFDLTADHYRCSDRISVKSNHEIFRGTPV